MVWIKCKTGEFLDPKKIRSIEVTPCYGCPGEVEIFALYDHERFLLFRTTDEGLRKMGVRNNKERFAAIISGIAKKHEQDQCITYEDIFSMILNDTEEPAPDRGP